MDAGGSYGNDPALVLDEFFQTAAMNNNVFRMHLMAFDFKTLSPVLNVPALCMQGYFLRSIPCASRSARTVSVR